MTVRRQAHLLLLFVVVHGHPLSAGPAPGTQTHPVGQPQTAVLEFTAARPATDAERLMTLAQPSADDWESEILSDRAAAQLTRLSGLIGAHALATKDLVGLVDRSFTCTRLLPQLQSPVYQGRHITVRRFLRSDDAADETFRGADGLADALRPLAEAIGRHARVKLKVFQIEQAGNVFTTRVRLETAATRGDVGIQHSGVWHCRWTVPAAPTDGPLLAQITVEQLEHVEVRAPQGRLFVDCTESALGANAAYGRQVRPGMPHWLGRMTRITGVGLLGHHGLAIGDADGDGLDDLYVCETGGLPNRLYRRNPDGTATDVSAQAGVDVLDATTSALFIDLDNDGDQDLVLAGSKDLAFLDNDGRGRFVRRSGYHTGGGPMSLTAADPDQDGDLDLYVCVYTGGAVDRSRLDVDLPTPVPYHDANNGGVNALLRNDGGFRFVDVTRSCGLGENNTRFSFSASWDDYDNDADLDLYVANDFGRNNLYRNESGPGASGGVRFVDVAAAAGVEDVASGMSAAWADCNRDGHMDLYVSNMFSAAGNRVAFQRRFTGANTPWTTADIQRMARGNTLFANHGDGTFSDVSETAGVTVGRWAWASKFADLNNDGWSDLVVANGYITNEDSGDL